MSIRNSLVRLSQRCTEWLKWRRRTLLQAPAIAADGTSRVLFVANAIIPTLQICFLRPLKNLTESGKFAIDFITEFELRTQFGHYARSEESRQWISEKFASFDPTVVVLCRYSGPNVEHIVEASRARNIPVIFHIDDDLLDVPIEIGEKKHAMHNEPMRLSSIRYLLDEADLVYSSTQILATRLREHGARARIKAGKIVCSGEIMVPASLKPTRKVGYMGFDHAHDLEMILPALVRFLDENPDIQFELFGSIPKPAALDRFGNRISHRPPVPDYGQFLEAFSALGWDIGICPLATTRFNSFKANNKWVEYTSIGAAVVASGGTIYDQCCADGCGSLAYDLDMWHSALSRLATDESARYRQVAAAQRRLMREYTTERLQRQVVDMMMLAN